jgi:hypothetical protein
MHRLGFGLGLLAALLLGGAPACVQAQPDSVRAALLEERGFSPTHSPRGALWRAAAVPGWGQFYNRQYYKMPFVYAGLAGGAYAIYEMNRRYRLFRRANLFVVGEGDPNPYQDFRSEYERAADRLGASPGSDVSGRQLRRLRDKYRRWRDLAILGTGLFYALTVLDAYVSAHLLTFDVGEDLALRVRPTGGSAPPEARSPTRASTQAPTAPVPRASGVGLRFHLRF